MDRDRWSAIQKMLVEILKKIREQSETNVRLDALSAKLDRQDAQIVQLLKDAEAEDLRPGNR